MSWSRLFHGPIEVPKGKPLRTLKDAADYVLRLSKKVTAAEHWQIAMEQLIDAAEAGTSSCMPGLGCCGP
jgi:hypothetical protein